MRPSFSQIASCLPPTATPKLSRSFQPILSFAQTHASRRDISKPSSPPPLSNTAAASPSPDAHFWAIDDAESVYGYVSGGYHPLAIGDTLGGRYHVRYKLGHGGYSCVWLARDQVLQRLVAVKVCIADAGQREARVLAHIDRLGKARELFTELSWPILDLHIGNVLLQLPRDVQTWSDETLLAQCGEPESELVKAFDDKPLPPNVPVALSLPTWFPMAEAPDLTLEDTRIIIADFGESYCPSQESRFECRTPAHVRPPESWFEPTTPKSFPSDIWSLACAMWAALAQRPLFETIFSTDDTAIRMQVQALGKLPGPWWERWEARGASFTADGELVDPEERVYDFERHFEEGIQDQRKRVAGMQTMSVDEKEALIALMRSMLAYRPEQWCDINEVLGSAWMVKYAMPELREP